jgi:DNA-binding IclR family transcriptional regulator
LEVALSSRSPYSILNAVQNRTLNSKVLRILRERTTPMTEQEISRLLDIPLASLQQWIDSLFGQGLIEQVADPHWQERAKRLEAARSARSEARWLVQQCQRTAR